MYAWESSGTYHGAHQHIRQETPFATPMTIQCACAWNKRPHGIQNSSYADLDRIFDIVSAKDAQFDPEAVGQWLLVNGFLRVTTGGFAINRPVDFMRTRLLGGVINKKPSAFCPRLGNHHQTDD